MGPADLLHGKTLQNNWKVVKKLDKLSTDTGGNFSTGYVVENVEGKRAFMKAMDYSRAFRSTNHVQAINDLTSAYLFEKNICDKCTGNRMDRVVHAIDSFTFIADVNNPFSKVECLIFTLADGDVRRFINTAKNFDLAFALRALHHVSTGLQQLHRSNIAHQDLKPSNVLVYGKDIGSKISDMGRAWAKDYTATHDNYPIAGDPQYAPPELLYNHIPPDVNYRRYGCDLYLLGSLASFFFTSIQMNGLLISNMSPDCMPFTWSGTYQDLLPYLQSAYADSLEALRNDVPVGYKDDITELVSYLCQPDPMLRGHPLSGRGGSHQFSLEKFISRFDFLATKAEIHLASGVI